MKKFLIFIIFSAALIAGVIVGQPKVYEVTRVVDGDTIVIDMDGEKETLRLIGVDTPETKHPKKPVECYGPEASEYVVQSLLGRHVGLEHDGSQGERGRYGRLLVYVYLNEQNFNETLVRQGYAKEYTYSKPYKYQKKFVEAQREAISEEVGMWKQCNY